MIVICGKSGSGKDTIAKELLGLGVQRVITYTTRPRRSGEMDGETYHFISDDKFQSLLEDGFFIETTKYNVATGEVWRYGTPFNGLSKDKFVVMNPDGVKSILKHPEYNPIVFYMYTDDVLRMKRLADRGDMPDEVRRRKIADEKDFADIDQYYDFIVPNHISKPRAIAEYIYHEHERHKHEDI